MKRRKCVGCGGSLTDEDVMKIEFEDGSWEIMPLPVCPDCFEKQMCARARAWTGFLRHTRALECKGQGCLKR